MNFTEYDPRLIPYQMDVIRDIRTKFDYSNGPVKVLLSGAVGSGKTTLLAHLVVTHCLLNDKALVGIGRLSLKYLKDTLFKAIIEQVGDIIKIKINHTSATIKFPNGSEIISFSWSDKQYKKFRSYSFSAFAIEELTETPKPQAFREIYSRLGRAKHIDECWLLCATNPDEPSHWVYDEFIKENDPNKMVYYSRTRDNKILPPNYEKQLRRTYDPLMARRMLDGEWLSIAEDVIYYQFSEDNIMDNYKVNLNELVYISWDFNIGQGKPFSLCLAQFIDGTAYYFDEVILDGMRTQDSLDELEVRGYLSGKYKLAICADATGSSRDTRGTQSDIDIIKKYIDNLPQQILYRMMVPRKNPPMRLRHNLVNAYLKNSLGEVKLKVAKSANTIIEGLKHTKLKKGATLIEDDSYRAQHVTTALGYALYQMHQSTNRVGISQGDR